MSILKAKERMIYLKFLWNVRKIDYIHIRQFLELKGWKVKHYNTPSGDEIVRDFELEDILENTDGYVYDVGLLKYVFINSELSERDKIIVALHETGHIVLEQDLTQKDNKLNELEAWKFAADMYYLKSFLCRRLIVLGIDLLIALSAVLGAWCAIGRL